MEKEFTLDEIEKSICPKANELIKENAYVYCDIIDDALDPIRCEFDGCGAVTIKTDGYAHIDLNLDNLMTLIKNIALADDYLENTYFDLDGNIMSKEEAYKFYGKK
jgi:hypothetical protein